MKNFISSLIITIAVVFSIQAQDFRFGAGGQLIFDGSVFGLQGKALYNVNESIDAAATVTIHLEEFVDWTVDLDAHYLLLELGNEIGFKPFAGLSITRFSFSILGVNTADTDIGLNLGAFFDVLKTGDYQIYIEPKLIIGGAESLAVSAGILF